jgi:hypothetical protein
MVISNDNSIYFKHFLNVVQFNNEGTLLILFETPMVYFRPQGDLLLRSLTLLKTTLNTRRIELEKAIPWVCVSW